MTPPPALTDTHDPLLGTTLEGGVHLVERLGETGVGALYRGEAYLDRREVAVLLLLPEADPGALRDRFRHAIRIRHPGVAGVEAMGETPDGRTFVVLELLAGELLSALLAEHRAPGSRAAVDIVLQAASGLQAAHAVDLLHGHVSPASLLITRPGGKRPIVKVLGFALESSESDAGGATLRDSPYAAPERLSGAPPSRAGDVYGLGAVLLHLLTGVAPQIGTGAAGGGRPPPRHLQAVIARALSVSAGERYQSAGEFASALELAAGGPARARRAGVRRGLTIGVPAALLVGAALWIPWRAIGSAAGGAVHSVTRRMAAPAEVGLERNAANITADSAPAPSAAPASPAPPTAGPASSTSPARPAPAIIRSPTALESVTNISPFRRRFPWAGLVDGRTYFPSGCDAALRAAELVYFRSEAQARTQGRIRSRKAGGCS